MIDDRKSINNMMNTSNIVQNLILENRGKLSVSGVNDVLSFDDQIIIVETSLGLLTIKGEDLKINKLNIETSDLIIEGLINSLAYSGNSDSPNRKGGNLLGKIFK